MSPACKDARIVTVSAAVGVDTDADADANVGTVDARDKRGFISSPNSLKCLLYVTPLAALSLFVFTTIRVLISFPL